MFEIRIHGRGGQGVVTAAELLSVAAFLDGKYSQAFPSFGSERTGAPVAAYCRIAEAPIRLREPIANPNALIVQDPTLVHSHLLFDGLARDGYVVLNSSKTAEELGLANLEQSLPKGHFVTVPATELARQFIGRPIPNVVLLGAFAALTGLIHLDKLSAAIKERFTVKIAEKNIAAATASYELITRPAEKLVDQEC